jgi:lipopolysaccharide/colanic/teichoic acid biosynthesis glycosyltransferase
MSFVGPRPEVPEYTDAYTAEERRILDVRPGITDLASIQFSDLQEHVGHDDPDRTYREKVLPRKNQLRLQYADQQNLALDLRILVTTVALVLGKALSGPFRRGAAAAPRSQHAPHEEPLSRAA